jgi:Ca2+-dependent lipid-binding protein
LECVGSDHGVKAKGNGWLLTVALIDGTNLAATKSSGYSDPYVVFTCNGKTKTSSIKFHTLGPQWNGKTAVCLAVIFVSHCITRQICIVKSTSIELFLNLPAFYFNSHTA